MKTFNKIASGVFVELVTYFETNAILTKEDFNGLVTRHKVIQFKKNEISDFARKFFYKEMIK
jgi:hypothetical protein